MRLVISTSLFRSHWTVLERLLVASTVVTIGISQVLFNLILSNPEHFPTSGLFFIYVIAAVQLIPIFLVVGLDSVLFRVFGQSRVVRGWRTLLYLFVLVSVIRQAELLSFEPVRSWLLALVATHPVVWVLVGLAVAVAFWYGYRTVNYFIVYLTPLMLVLTGIFVWQTGLFGSAWHGDVVTPVLAAEDAAPAELVELPPIFIIMWDELEPEVIVKDGLLVRQLVPNFAALADDSVWFPNAQTPVLNTDVDIMTFLTGTTVDAQGSFSAPTIFERLASRYEIHLYEEKAVLARQFGCIQPNVTCRGELYLQTHFPIKAAKWAVFQYLNLLVPVRAFQLLGFVPSTYEPQISRILEDVRTSPDSGNLFYWHPILPHAPYVYNPDGSKHDGSGSVEENYLKQVQFVDALLGRFVAMLHSEGLYDKSILVVTSDHGKQTKCPCPIPLIIRAPGHPPEVSEATFNHVDFVPTLLDLLGMAGATDDRLDGVSAFSPDRRSGSQSRD